jgi:hypothetical protein
VNLKGQKKIPIIAVAIASFILSWQFGSTDNMNFKSCKIFEISLRIFVNEYPFSATLKAKAAVATLSQTWTDKASPFPRSATPVAWLASSSRFSVHEPITNDRCSELNREHYFFNGPKLCHQVCAD